MSTLILVVLVLGFAGTDNAYLQSLIVDIPLQYHKDVYSILELTSYTASKYSPVMCIKDIFRVYRNHCIRPQPLPSLWVLYTLGLDACFYRAKLK
jgi:hypothetical protein